MTDDNNSIKEEPNGDFSIIHNGKSVNKMNEKEVKNILEILHDLYFDKD